MSTQTYIGTLHVLHCYKCGVPFGLTDALYERRLADGESFWCPNGHSQRFVESKVKRLQRQLTAEQERAQRAERRAQAQRERAEHEARRAAASRGVATRLKKRVAQGKCPCCQAAFADLKAHMDTVHPGYAEDRAS